MRRDPTISAFIAHRQSAWDGVLDFKALLAQFRKLLRQGVSARARSATRPIAGAASPAQIAPLEELLPLVLDALCHAVYSGDSKGLRAFARPANALLQLSEDEFGAVAFDRTHAAAQRRIIAFGAFLRDEVQDLISKPHKVEVIARACADTIASLCTGLPSDGWSREKRYEAILGKLRRLQKRLSHPEAIVLAALRACGFDNPNLFKGEQMASGREGRAKRRIE